MKRSMLALLVPLFLGPSQAEAAPLALGTVDRVRLAEAFRIGERLGDRIWKGWHRAPFAVLLVTPDAEYLVRHPRPPAESLSIGYEPTLESEVYALRSTHPLSLLATFPVNGVPTIVVGQAENTDEKTSSRWVMVLLHEHFHQLQYADPTYAEAVEALGLAGGDRTGMWMLNYPFPFDAPEVTSRFATTVRALSDAFGAIGTDDLRNRFPAYLKAREAFLATLTADQRRYFAFQTWQEGVAMYTQYRVADLAARRYRPTPEFAALHDYTPFADVARTEREDFRNELPNLSLGDHRRIAFYYVGSAEAFLLDTLDRRWHGRYFKEKFSLDGSLKATGYIPGSSDAPAPHR